MSITQTNAHMYVVNTHLEDFGSMCQWRWDAFDSTSLWALFSVTFISFTQLDMIQVRKWHSIGSSLYTRGIKSEKKG